MQGFDVDWTKARCLYNYHPVVFDDDVFVEEPETNLDLLNRLCEKSIGHYNQENVSPLIINCFFVNLYSSYCIFLSLFFKQMTAYEFVKPLYANCHGCTGIMFLITFQVKDPVENLTKDFQARIHYSYCSKSQFIMCRPKHHQADSLGVAENDPKKPRYILLYFTIFYSHFDVIILYMFL